LWLTQLTPASRISARERKFRASTIDDLPVQRGGVFGLAIAPREARVDFVHDIGPRQDANTLELLH
jgi:hypothetical protein